ncbi:phosphonate transporter [Massilia sp. TWR1-2-2]|uniref:phosphonate transporter n=1 Tax=Massilia sp. TWR1-2-2 TaxID=2804584 RepID=UPI003CF7686C
MIQPGTPNLHFDIPKLFAKLLLLSADELDELSFGVIGFDAEEKICIYNVPEAGWAGLNRNIVLGTPMFEVVAPCMNNYLVAQRFEHALQHHEALDATLDYVLTLRMRPTPCALRLLAEPTSRIRFVLVSRK